MNKYTLVGAVNLFLGGLAMVVSITGIAIYIPRLTELYSDIGVTLPSSAYFVYGLIALMGVANLFVSSKLLSKVEKLKDKYLKYGVILAIGTFVFSGVFYPGAFLSVISFIYNLTTAL